MSNFVAAATQAVDIIIDNAADTLQYRTWAIGILYTIAYKFITGDYFDATNLTFAKLREMPIVDEFALKAQFGRDFIEFRDIVWDVPDRSAADSKVPPPQIVAKSIPDDIIAKAKQGVISTPVTKGVDSVYATPKSNLYISPPKYPRMNTDVISFMEAADYGRASIIYQSLPQIPLSQNQISLTTQADKLIDSDLLKLFPTHIIHTRKSSLYDPIDGLDYDEDIGVIIPIKGFTTKQIVDNIIRYPHIHQLKRKIGDTLVPFQSYIEIDGSLERVDKIWQTLPISKYLEPKPEYVTEYVVRRYLLERDIRKIAHKSTIEGTLDPFLTLFAPPDFYAGYRYKDPIELARLCVKSRISYRASRNGVINNSGVSNCIFAPYCVQSNCNIVCPTYQQIDYLLSQNELTVPDPVFSMASSLYDYVDMLYTKYTSGFHLVESASLSGKSIPDSTTGVINALPSASSGEVAKLITYCGICNNWRGSQFSMVVYQLRFSQYIDKLRSSWNQAVESDALQYMRIWARSSKVLVISNFDFVSFGDFECQTLLQLIQDRADAGKLTFLVCRDRTKLVGRSSFFSVLSDTLKEARVE